MLRLCIVPFLPYLSERPTHSRIFFVFRTILLRAALFSEVFCHVWSFLLFPVVLGTSVDSALHLSATMASADFCTFSVAFRSRLLLSEHSVQLLDFDLDGGLIPSDSLYTVPVRQARGLPPASFRFHLTVDTLAFGCIFPAAGQIPDFHRLETCAAGRTILKKPDLSMKEAGFFSVYADFFISTFPTAPGTPRSERPESPNSPR